MVLFQIITISIGIIYGYLKPGKEDRAALFKKGLLIGIVLALIFVGLAALLGGGTLLILGGVVGIVIFIQVIVFAVLFIIGTLVGDWLEEKNKAKTV